MSKILYGSIFNTGREEVLKASADLIDVEAPFAYIVPTFQLKKEIEETIIEEKGGMAIATPPIYLFDGFVNETLKDLLAYKKPISAYQQRLILKNETRKLREEGQLTYLDKIADYDGFYQSLLDWLKEVKSTGKTPEEWLKLYPESRKEYELGCIYQNYENFLTVNQLVDEEGNYLSLINQIENKEDALEGLELVVVDGFYKLSQLQMKLIQVIADQQVEVMINTYYEEERDQLFLSSNELIQQFADLGPGWESKKIDQSNFEERSSSLRHLGQNLFNLNTSKEPGQGALEIFYTPDQYHEVEEIGRWIKKLLIEEEELNLSQIAVIFRNVDHYHNYLDDIFTGLGLPYQISNGLELKRTPLFKLIIKIFNVSLEEWSRESVLELLKSPYLEFNNSHHIEELEELILEAGIIRGRREWSNKLNQYRYRLEKKLERTNLSGLTEKLNKVEELQQLLTDLFKSLDQLMGKGNLYKKSQQLLDFLTKYHLTREIVKTDDEYLLRRDLLSLENIQQLLLDLIEFGQLLDAEQYSPQEFMTLLQRASEEIQIPEPRIEHDAIQILTPSQSRGRSFKYAVVGGMLEGEFPWYGRRDWLFDPQERRKLKEQGINFKQAYQHLEEERLFFLEAVSTAQEKLVITCPTMDTEESVQKSSFIQEVLNLFAEDTVLERRIATNLFVSDDILTRRGLEELFLNRLWKSGINGEIDFDGDLKVLEDIYLRGEMIQSRTDKGYNKFDGLLEKNSIVTRLKDRYNSEFTYSVSQINEYAFCPFKYYCNKILNLGQLEDPALRLEALDLGNLYHHILYDFFKDFEGFQEVSIEEALKDLQQVAEEVMENYLPGINLPEGLWSLYQEEIMDTLNRVLTYEYQEAAKQNYLMKPTYLEASFGLNKNYREEESINYDDPLIIENETGQKVRFQGKIDRVDMSKRGNYLILYDYKLGSRAGYNDIVRGIDFQLPIYIKAAQAIFGEDKEVLGAGYFSILRGERKAGLWLNEEKSLIPVTSRSKSCIDREEWDQILKDSTDYIINYTDRIKEGVFIVDPADECPDYCPYIRICRYEPTRIGSKEVE